MSRFYNEYGIDDGSESVSERTRHSVFHRDGGKCWLCEDSFDRGLQVAHQIGAAEYKAFERFKLNGTLPATIPDPSHKDNLISLCQACHLAYDAAFPDWILLPDVPTLKKYIQHEKEDYELRQATSPSPPRTLPVIDRSKILYHPALISPALPSAKFNFSRWPKGWLGEPTTVIHRAARRGLLESSPLQPIFSGRGRRQRGVWQRGVPVIFQVLIGELCRLWARPDPVKGPGYGR